MERYDKNGLVRCILVNFSSFLFNVESHLICTARIIATLQSSHFPWYRILARSYNRTLQRLWNGKEYFILKFVLLCKKLFSAAAWGLDKKIVVKYFLCFWCEKHICEMNCRSGVNGQRDISWCLRTNLFTYEENLPLRHPIDDGM